MSYVFLCRNWIFFVTCEYQSDLGRSADYVIRRLPVKIYHFSTNTGSKGQLRRKSAIIPNLTSQHPRICKTDWLSRIGSLHVKGDAIIKVY